MDTKNTTMLIGDALLEFHDVASDVSDDTADQAIALARVLAQIRSAAVALRDGGDRPKRSIVNNCVYDVKSIMDKVEYS